MYGVNLCRLLNRVFPLSRAQPHRKVSKGSGEKNDFLLSEIHCERIKKEGGDAIGIEKF